MRAFVRSLYDNHEFLDDFEPFVAHVALAGEHASLGALLLRLTTPGLPDIYQGDAFWSLNLVDPDNRRPVDWSRAQPRRARRPHRTRETMKFHLIRRVLRLRAEYPEAFFGSLRAARPRPRPASGSSAAGGSASSCRSGRPTGSTAPGDLLPEYPQELSLLR